MFCPVDSFSFYCSCDHRDLHSFPTRRSSDLERRDHQPVAELSQVLQERELFVALGGVLGHRARLESTSDRKSTRLNSSHLGISYAVFCLKKKNSNAYKSQHKQGHITQLSCNA